MNYKVGPREEYRQQENKRVHESATLADKFQQLKSLTVDLEFYNSGGLTRNSQIKYTVNLDRAKSVFSFQCHNNECVCGDFDLSEHLARAVASHETHTTGESCCQGWLSKATIDRVHCHNILRYRLNLEY